jgi:hypothetical protein
VFALSHEGEPVRRTVPFFEIGAVQQQAHPVNALGRTVNDVVLAVCSGGRCCSAGARRGSPSQSRHRGPSCVAAPADRPPARLSGRLAAPPVGPLASRAAGRGSPRRNVADGCTRRPRVDSGSSGANLASSQPPGGGGAGSTAPLTRSRWGLAASVSPQRSMWKHRAESDIGTLG